MNRFPIRPFTGLCGWIIASTGAYLYGGIGLLLISIGLPILIHNWDQR